ncbi:MAG: hypothetical protein IT305_32855 [Chloroflexi bacterium]|nr:hypothetical protein [Chloroflexota bacterium]
MEDLRSIYLEQAVSQMPRLLSLQDRNPLSPTYGSFHRLYWLDKSIDFPDAMAQFAVQALALAYTLDVPGNPYAGQPKLRDWIVAGLEYWARIQHRDGSFDEFYPYERGWVGPTGFTLYAAIEAYQAVRDALTPDATQRILTAIRRAAHVVAAGESEEDKLANHHALACVAVWEAFELLGDPELERGFERLWRGLLTYRNVREGWWLEYDGADPGYLSATVSFLAKLHLCRPSPEIVDLAREAVEFASYFAYPDGHYGGSLGSRQTLHFYPHGVEVLADQIPLAGALAQRMLEGLRGGALVPPTIMPDRYMPWRMAEYLLAYRDARPRSNPLPALPYQREPFRRWFPEARIDVRRTDEGYVLANLAKGGVVRAFNVEASRLVYSDCGILGRLADGRMVTSQWIAPGYQIAASDAELTVTGALQRMTSTTTFTPLKMALFRAGLASVGQSTRASHAIKGGIRRMLMFGTRSVPLCFRRRIRFEPGALTVTDVLQRTGKVLVSSLLFGDEFAVRYVPQSRFFQFPDLEARGYLLPAADLTRFNAIGRLTVTRRVDLRSGATVVEVDGAAREPLDSPAERASMLSGSEA